MRPLKIKIHCDGHSTWGHIRKLILEKIRTDATNVVMFLLGQTLWGNVSKLTLVNNLISATKANPSWQTFIVQVFFTVTIFAVIIVFIGTIGALWRPMTYNDQPNPIPSNSIHLYNWMNLHQSVDKARQWSDLSLIKLLNDILVW